MKIALLIFTTKTAPIALGASFLSILVLFPSTHGLTRESEISLLFALILALFPRQVPAPPQKPKPPEAMVKVEDRSITLPPLPGEGHPGRGLFQATHAQIKAAMEDLTAGLQALYEKPEALKELPVELSIPSEDAAEGTLLLSVIDDKAFVQLEQAYLDTWKGWQAALVEGGLASRVQAAPKVAEPRSTQYLAAKQKAKLALQAPSREVKPVSRLDAGYRVLSEREDTFSEAELASIPKEPEERMVEKAHSKDIAQAQKRLVVANLLLLDLAAAWNPLVDLLNERAQRVVNQEKGSPSGDATMNALRLHAKLAVMERFRTALWYCDLVWCQLASEQALPPPRKLSGMLPNATHRP